MNEGIVVDETQGITNPVGPYMVYSAGGLFTQDELTTNVLIKEAVWRLSNGKFQMHLPQSVELQELDRLDIEAQIRNIDLLAIMKSDIILVRFDGSELESGTVVEFTVAKSLGKPTVILRCDFRRSTGTGLSDPYNLMVKNWPRTVNVYLNSFVLWSGLFSEEHQALRDRSGQDLRHSSGQAQDEDIMKAELGTIQKSFDEIAMQVIGGMEVAIKMKSPYPPEYQETIYKAARFSPGCDFDQLLPEKELEEIIQRLRNNGTL